MKIKEITSQHRRDLSVIYECEHCNHTIKGIGYDDFNFHNNVIPKMVCSKCKKTGGNNYKPLTTKYPDGQQV